MPDYEIVSVRIAITELQQMQALAIVDESTLTNEIRRAIRDYIQKRKSEPGFEQAIENAKKRQNELLNIFNLR